MDNDTIPPYSPFDPEETAQRLLEEEGWPDVLIKATHDPFDYACYIEGIGEIRFGAATRAGKGWVRLEAGTQGDQLTKLGHAFERGVEVRVDRIVWVADAPDGSP
jgi:hypothetical protein